MSGIDDPHHNFFLESPYAVDKESKKLLLLSKLQELTRFHYENCASYRNILDSISFDMEKMYHYEDLPFIPVRLFKELDLYSVPNDLVVRTMTSSGTSGQQVSKIYLDKNTANLQRKVLAQIVSQFIGSKRLPMIVIDTASTISNRTSFSARAAGIMGFSSFSNDRFFALKDDMSLDLDGLQHFVHSHAGKKVLVFGFTFMVWQYFLESLSKQKQTLELGDAILIHGGGWKKLAGDGVSSEVFRSQITSQTGIVKIHDYYGMIEQTGSIFMECEKMYLHTSIYSDVIIRNPLDFSVMPYNEKGIIEVLSMVATSYPGHVLLTEDAGMIFGEDDCGCGRKGKYFKVLGRLEHAEIRGCSDTHTPSA